MIEVVSGGLQTIVVDWPGRIGYWSLPSHRRDRWTASPSALATCWWETRPERRASRSSSSALNSSSTVTARSP